jgi:hypothetical protein
MRAQPEIKHYDLAKGRYGVTVSVGKAYKSRVEQGKDELGQLFQAEPELFKILGDIYLKFADFPGHREAAERVKKMLPPPLQDQDEAGAAQEAAHLKAQLQAMQQQMSEMAKALETDKVKVDGQIAIAQLKTSADLKIVEMNNAAKVLVARITAAKEAASETKEDAEEQLALGLNLAHEAAQADLDRQQEQQHMQHQAAMAAAGAAVQGGEAERGRQHDASMSDRGHQQALEQSEQAAALAPKPEAKK